MTHIPDTGFTRDGRPYRITSRDNGTKLPITAVVDMDGSKFIHSYTTDGFFWSSRSPHPRDICERFEPRQELVSSPQPQTVTLRDQFAMNALTALLMNNEVVVRVDEMPKLSYQIADAMLKARETAQ